jgi:chromosomal replication initiator protein
LRVGNSNRFAVKAGESVVQKPGASYNPLCIIGGPGLGKTHLLNAIGVAIREKHPKMNVVSVPSGIFSTNLHRSEDDGAMEEFRGHYGGADVLLIDDMDELAADDPSIAEIDRMMEGMLKMRKQVVISSTLPPHRLKSMPEKVRAMMDSGLVVEIKMPSDDIKKGFIMDAAGKLGIDLPESAVEKLCSLVDTDIRTLESFLRRLKAHSEMEGARIVPEMVEEMLTDMRLRPGEASDAPAQGAKAAKEVKAAAGGSSFVCDACNTVVPGDSSTCPGCGASFDEAVYQCPKCGAEVPAGTTKCPGCQSEFAV